jgi:hypothetical protein
MELLNNVIKHSNAENTTLSLQEVENELLIHVRDNGVGFDTNEYNTIEGFGLNQIQARINNMEGELVIKSKLNVEHQYTLKSPFCTQLSYARFSISIISKSFILSPSITKRSMVRTDENHFSASAGSYVVNRISYRTSPSKYVNVHK